MPETLRGKIVRHVKAGQFDPQTLKRGVDTMFRHLLARNEDQGELVRAQTTSDLCGINGLSLTHYDFQRGLLGLDHFLNGIAHLYPAEYKVYEFPQGSRILPILTPRDQRTHTKEIIDQYPEAFATFTGPTYKSYVGMPNNGFYFKPDGELVAFEDTNPPGGRRGAFAITEQLNPVVIDDDLKWAIRHAEFPQIKAVVGTSTFFSGKESSQDIADPDTGKINGSYLFQYQDESDQTKTGFMVSAWVGARRTMKRVLDDYVSSKRGLGYFAVELELASAQCVVRGPKGRNIYGHGFKDRLDHYLVLPPDASPAPDELKDILTEQMQQYY
jgi:hypothetical protein